LIVQVSLLYYYHYHYYYYYYEGEYFIAVGDNSTTYSSYNSGISFVNNDPTTVLGDVTSLSSNGTFGFILIATSNSGPSNPAGIYKSNNWLVSQPTSKPSNPSSTNKPTSSKASNKKSHIVLIGVIVGSVVVVGIIAAAIYSFYRHRNKTKPVVPDDVNDHRISITTNHTLNSNLIDRYHHFHYHYYHYILYTYHHHHYYYY